MSKVEIVENTTTLKETSDTAPATAAPAVNVTNIKQDEEERPPLERVASGPPYSIFSPQTKLFILVSVSISSLISPFGATTFYPALDVLAVQLHVTPSLIDLSLTTYMVCTSSLFTFTYGRLI